MRILRREPRGAEKPANFEDLLGEVLASLDSCDAGPDDLDSEVLASLDSCDAGPDDLDVREVATPDKIAARLARRRVRFAE